MDTQERQRKLRELEELRQRMSRLEAELAEAPERYRPTDFYAAYYATTGFMLGMLAAAASLIFNVVGSAAIGQHPLRIIQVYLTFPLGEKALTQDLSSDMTLTVGVCLYIATGAVLGIPIQLLLARFAPNASLVIRLVLTTIFGLALWLFNFYVVLAWLQPLLFKGNWIVDPLLLPPWVAAATHLVFAWTMALIYPWGAYVPYRPQTEMA